MNTFSEMSESMGLVPDSLPRKEYLYCGKYSAVLRAINQH